MSEHLDKIRNILIPFRYYSVNKQACADFAETLISAGKAANEDDREFFEFFCDALFLIEEDGTDRAGIFKALPALEDVLVSLIDYANCPLDFKAAVTGAVARFKAALEIYAAANNLSKVFNSGAEKKINVCLYYLAKFRSNFIPEEDLPGISSIEAENNLSAKDFIAARKVLSDRPRLAISERNVKTALYALKILDLPKTESDAKKKQAAEQIEKQVKLKAGALVKLINQALRGLEERWRKICLTGYYATRLAAETPAQNLKTRTDRRTKASWAITGALEFVPSWILDRSDVQLRLPRGMISEAVKLCYDQSTLKYETVDQIARLAWYLLRGYKYDRRFHKRQNRKEFKFNTRKKPTANPSEAEQLAAADAWKDELSVQTKEGAAPEEFELAADEPVKQTSPEGSSNRSKAFRPSHEYASWSRISLTDETLAVVHAWLKKQATESPDSFIDRAALLFFELQLNFGFAPEYLLNAQIFAGGNEGEAVSNLVIKSDSVTVRPVRPGGKNAFAAALAEESEYYLPSRRDASFELPAALAKKLTASCIVSDATNGKFLYEILGRKTPAAAKNLLNKLFKPLAELIGEHLSTEKVGKAVRALLREEKTLTGLQIALVTGEIPQHTASQMFYTSFYLPELRIRRARAFRSINEQIIESGKDYVTHLGLTLAEPGLPENDLSQYNFSEAQPEDLSRIGSPYVPQAASFGKYINRLKTGINESSNFVVRHNRQTAYAALALMTLTGLRPLELSYLAAQHLDLDSATPAIAVTAKINRKHSEWRALPLPPAVVKVLKDYQTSSTETRRHHQLLSKYSSAGIDLRLGDSFFFFLRLTFAPVRISTRGLGELLRDESYLQLEKFPWKLNAPRHLYRTAACELGTPEKIINSLLGHQTAGTEAVGIFSAYDRSAESSHACRIAAHISDLLTLNHD